MKNNDSAWLTHPDYQINISLVKKHACILMNKVMIADSHQALLLSEQNHSPVYYFPRQDVRMELLHKISKITFCPFKGEATHWALFTNDAQVKVAAWSYEDPFEQVSAIKNHIAFYPDVLDHIIID